MVSLTTIYGTGAAIGTVAAFVAAYIGHKIYPIQTGGMVVNMNVSSLDEAKTNLAKFVGNDTAERVTNIVNETINFTKRISTPPQQPLNTEVTPLEPPVEETPLPSVDLAPQNNPFNASEPPVEQSVSS